MEEVEDPKPTDTAMTKKRALPEESGDDDETEKLEVNKEGVSLYDKRISTGEIIEGKRQKKTVERLDFSVAKPRERVKIEQGRGVKLGDIIRVAYFIGKMKAEDLKPLHKVIFDRPGAASSVKKNIRQFSGFPFEADSQMYMKKKERMKKYTNPVLKNMCFVLDLERSGTNDAKIDRILAFLLDPKMSGKPLPKKKKRTKEAKRKAQRKSGKGKNAQEDSNSLAMLTDSSSEDNVNDEDDDDGQDGQGDEGPAEKSRSAPKSREIISDDEDLSEDEVTDKDSDEEFKQTKVAKKPAPKKKQARKTPAAAKVAAKTKKADSSSGRRKKANVVSEGSEEDDSSDDEPLAKIARKPLTDEQLKETVQRLLKGADLDKVTMKQICKQVFDAYPDHDLSSRKGFIKQTVKELLS
ncbi:hypothetical protein GJAV_G00020600 [Gymnothorax javanicus]|nr:hypothetical protein GJAV_G00020600 [Gymnothorax javanicus]